MYLMRGSKMCYAENAREMRNNYKTEKEFIIKANTYDLRNDSKIPYTSIVPYPHSRFG